MTKHFRKGKMLFSFNNVPSVVHGILFQCKCAQNIIVSHSIKYSKTNIRYTPYDICHKWMYVYTNGIFGCIFRFFILEILKSESIEWTSKNKTHLHQVTKNEIVDFISLLPRSPGTATASMRYPHSKLSVTISISSIMPSGKKTIKSITSPTACMWLVKYCGTRITYMYIIDRGKAIQVSVSFASPIVNRLSHSASILQVKIHENVSD